MRLAPPTSSTASSSSGPTPADWHVWRTRSTVWSTTGAATRSSSARVIRTSPVQPGSTTGTVAWVSDDSASLASTAAARTWASPDSSAGSSIPVSGQPSPIVRTTWSRTAWSMSTPPSRSSPRGDPTISNDVVDFRSSVASNVPPPRS